MRILSDAELAELRRLRSVIRMGRVTAIDGEVIALERGSVPTGPTTLHVDCSAAGIPPHPSTEVFADDRITLQWVRICQPTFSAALVGFSTPRSGSGWRRDVSTSSPAPPGRARGWTSRRPSRSVAISATWSRRPAISIASSRTFPPTDGVSSR